MTRLRIDAQAIAALGDRLDQIAAHLQSRAEESRDSIPDDYGFIGRSAEAALQGILGDYELERVTLCERLRALATLARGAGGCYVDTEDLVVRRVTPVYERGRKVGTL